MTLIVGVSIVFLVAVSSSISTAAQQEHFGPPGAIESHCESDMFEIRCQPNEVIVITFARYGRMRENRCISNAYGEIGCSIDVIDRLDSLCSGRRHCNVMVASLAKEKHQTCPKDFRSYLEISYKCIIVASAENKLCRIRPGPIELRHETQGFLSNLVAEETGCGSFDSPWWLPVVSWPPGQRVRLTMYEFTSDQITSSSATINSHGPSNSPVDTSLSLAAVGGQDPVTNTVCRVYAVIKEIGDGGSSSSISETICRDSSKRRGRVVYTSSGGRSAGIVEIRLANATTGVAAAAENRRPSGVGLSKLNDTKANKKNEYFLIAFEVIGCPEIEAPSNGWMRRSGNDVIMGCNWSSGYTWQLTCDEKSWQGDGIRNCTTATVDVAHTSWMSTLNIFGVTSLTVMIAIAVVVGITILCIGVGYMHSRKQHSPPGGQSQSGTSTFSRRANQQQSMTGTVPLAANERFVRCSDKRLPYSFDSASNLTVCQKLLTTTEQNNHYSTVDVTSIDATASSDEESCKLTKENAISSGRHLLLHAAASEAGNDYFHTVDWAGRAYHMSIGATMQFDPRRGTLPHQQFGNESTCYLPSDGTSGNRPTQLAFTEHQSMTTSEHIYESPKLDAASRDVLGYSHNAIGLPRPVNHCPPSPPHRPVHNEVVELTTD